MEIMNRNAFVSSTLILSFLYLIHTREATAANMRSFIEAVRRKAPVVYLGEVKEVHVLRRTKFDLKARAVVSVSAVVRGPGDKPSEATVEYSSYDEETPMLAGGPQYQLRPGAKVVIFADSFQGTVPPGYLIQGQPAELLQRVEALRDSLNQMSSDQLKVNEINEDDRRVQLALYEKLCGHLRSM